MLSMGFIIFFEYFYNQNWQLIIKCGILKNGKERDILGAAKIIKQLLIEKLLILTHHSKV